MSAKKKCRQYLVEYLKFGFIASPLNVQLPFCLMCEKTFSNEAMKPSRLKDHLSKIHSDKLEKPLSFFQALEAKIEKRSTVNSLFKKQTSGLDTGLVASYKVSLLIAKNNKHSIGETLILPALKEIIDTMQGEGTSNKVIKSISLSNDTVSKKIDEMADDIENKLINYLRENNFSLQIDESTVSDNKAILLAYVRFINECKEIVEKVLFATSLIIDTKGSSIFQAVEEYFTRKNVPLTNIIACATDCAPSMTGRHVGFIAHLKKAVPGIICVHCVIHRQHLAAKYLSDVLHETLQFAIKAVNKIKVSSLNDRMFRELCHDNDEDFERLLLYIAVRWLSKGKCLCRFFALFDSIIEFLDKIDPVLKDNLKRKIEIGYLTDIFEKMNEVNLKLQGNKMNFIKAKRIISSLIFKFDLYRTNMNRQELSQFPNLKSCSDANGVIPEDKIQIFSDHILQLEKDMNSIFQDLLELQICNLILDQFSFESVKDLELHLQMELTILNTTMRHNLFLSRSVTSLSVSCLKTLIHNYGNKLNCCFSLSRQRI
ncbi:SCAN domain-containing protein 3-like [Daktulosphaira vitifoliae]|uniref:SCAN domain-containing protein 3-like n=1 Tax=Daktulosphaira vitifoliae TaxID=58002 RepID=UPI0021A9C1DF|nr:SCAN domain-containing protein 3-like [Daktulosphaira vitifoliae]